MLDANVVITGILWPRWQHAVVQHALKWDFQLVLSPLVIAEASAHIRAIDPSQLEEMSFRKVSLSTLAQLPATRLSAAE